MTANLFKEFDTVFGTPDIYRRLVENLHAGIYVADAQGSLVYVNQAFVNILGYTSKDEVIGLNLTDQLYVHPEDRKEFLKKMEKLSYVRDYEVKNKRRDGSFAVLSVTSNIIYGEANEIIGVEGIIHDITEHKRIEKDLIILRKAIEQTADHVMITDKEGIIQYVNPSFERTTEYSKQEALGETPKILQSGKQTSGYYQRLWDTIRAGKTFHAHTINRNKNGELYVADQTISPITNESGEITHFVSIWKDVTEKVKLEELFKIEKQKLEEIIGFDEKISAIRKSNKLVDFVVLKTMKILEAKKCSIMLVDKESQELCLQASGGLEENMDPVRFKIDGSVAAMVIKDGQALLVKDIELDPQFYHHKEVCYIGRSFMIAPIMRDHDVIGVISVADKHTPLNHDDVFNELDLKILSDIAREVSVAMENVKYYKELQYLAITDPLTNIHNFRHFALSLDYEIKRLKRFSGELGLLMMDIDDFKSYNDHLGHPAGDQLLKEIGRIIQKNLRELDIFCRYAGDEFVIILPGTDKIGSTILAERIRQSIEQAKLKKQVTISIGVAQYKQNMTRHDLTSKADQALYKAKKEGKNKVCLFI